jgi:hypothetical protein
MVFTSLARYRNLATIIVLLAVAASGCGPNEKARAKVKGRVKFFDKYLTAGTVGFIAKDGRTGAANIDSDGNYEMTDAPIGDVTITVKVPSIGRGTEKARPTPPKGVPEAKMPGGSADEKSFVPSSIDPSKIVQIPGRYGSAETSGLTYTVTKGEQTKDIILTP